MITHRWRLILTTPGWVWFVQSIIVHVLKARCCFNRRGVGPPRQIEFLHGCRWLVAGLNIKGKKSYAVGTRTLNLNGRITLGSTWLGAKEELIREHSWFSFLLGKWTVGESLTQCGQNVVPDQCGLTPRAYILTCPFWHNNPYLSRLGILQCTCLCIQMQCVQNICVYIKIYLIKFYLFHTFLNKWWQFF